MRKFFHGKYLEIFVGVGRIDALRIGHVGEQSLCDLGPDDEVLADAVLAPSHLERGHLLGGALPLKILPRVVAFLFARSRRVRRAVVVVVLDSRSAAARIGFGVVVRVEDARQRAGLVTIATGIRDHVQVVRP